MKQFLVVFVAMVALVMVNSANAQQNVTFSISGSFESTAVRGQTTTVLSGNGNVSYNFQAGLWMGIEGGVGFSLNYLEPYTLYKVYLNQPGEGLHLGAGASYFFSGTYTFLGMYARVGWEQPIGRDISLRLTAEPGWKLLEDGGRSPGGFMLPVRVGFAFRL